MLLTCASIEYEMKGEHMAHYPPKLAGVWQRKTLLVRKIKSKETNNISVCVVLFKSPSAAFSFLFSPTPLFSSSFYLLQCHHHHCLKLITFQWDWMIVEDGYSRTSISNWTKREKSLYCRDPVVQGKGKSGRWCVWEGRWGLDALTLSYMDWRI